MKQLQSKFFIDLRCLAHANVRVIRSVVAVTGLAGHAFGCWRSRDTYKMWLKDFLPADVNNVRIMTYGYDSSLIRGTKSGTRLIDHRRNFIQQLENSRSKAKVYRCWVGFTLLLTIFRSSESAHHIPGAQFGRHPDISSKHLLTIKVDFRLIDTAMSRRHWLSRTGILITSPFLIQHPGSSFLEPHTMVFRLTT